MGRECICHPSFYSFANSMLMPNAVLTSSCYANPAVFPALHECSHVSCIFAPVLFVKMKIFEECIVQFKCMIQSCKISQHSPKDAPDMLKTKLN